MVMLAAYATFLGRVTGSSDVLVGTPISGRSTVDTEPLIGFFATTLPVRVDLSGDPTFTELVRRIRGSMFGVLAHRSVSFDSLVHELRLDRSTVHTPLVQTVFTFEPRPLAEPRLDGLTAQLVPLHTESAKFDLDFMIVRAGDGRAGCDLAVNYNTDVFEPATIATFADWFRRLLEAGVAEPDTPARALPMLSADERNVLVDDWSRSGARWPGALRVDELFSLQAKATPRASAVCSGAAVVTYAELNVRVDRVAATLRSRGVQPEDVVATLLPRGVDFVAAILGIARSGAAYLPLDPITPADRLDRVLSLAGATLGIGDADTCPRLAGKTEATVRIDDLASDAEGAAVSARGVTHSDNLAYVIFTSGSTGEPKGVGISHRALVNHAQAVRDRFALCRDDRVLQFSSVAFDVAAEELFPTLISGGCVVVCPDPAPAPEALSDTLVRGDVTVANLPASYWQHWAQTLDLPAASAAPRLRLLVVGSESVDPATLTAWCRHTGVPVVNAYGLTETTITAVSYRVPPEGPDRWCRLAAQSTASRSTFSTTTSSPCLPAYRANCT
ncbi:AMP-binding protein [Rhodococcus opacus]|nr:AMP-binding protein [Rhodococcus opacus]